MEEKRQFVRLSKTVGVKWSEAQAGQGEEQVQDMTMDISEGGICLIEYETLPVGKELNLEMELPTGKTIFSKGRVAWIREFEIIGGRREKGYEVGIQFIDISSEDKEEINRFTSRKQ
jgi:c-di-GMP-binding flagellar brake protein YcgR